MSTEEMKQLKEFITLNIQSVNAKAEYRSDIIENKISEMDKRITDRLDKINGKVNRHDLQIEEALIERSKNRQKQIDESERIDKSIEDMAKNHILDCPQNGVLQEIKKNINGLDNKIVDLEKESYSKKELKKMFFYALGVISTILIIAVNMDKIINLIVK